MPRHIEIEHGAWTKQWGVFKEDGTRLANCKTEQAADELVAVPDLLRACKAWMDWAEDGDPEGPLAGIAVEKLDGQQVCSVCCQTWATGQPPAHADDCPVLLTYEALAKAEPKA